MSSAQWDGRQYPYVYGRELRIASGLKLHTEVVERLDPITYEVIRHALWNINVEHGITIMKISGSPICAYGHDFNPCLLDEKGDFVFFGPFLQYLSSATSAAVKWTLEYRSENPGIEEDDIFLTNDPWIGATHQSDVTLIAPVFWEGELFCWVGNTLHQWDLGGTSPGGFNPMAPDVYWEAGCIPPIKIVERGRLRRDLEEEYIRRSRMPELVALDLRAEIAGCHVARERIKQLLARYGAATVKSVMRKLQDDSEKAFVRRLETIPDGTWRAVGWVEWAHPGDRHVYRNCLTLTKRGDRLIFSNEGTDPQAGTLNCTLVAWRGAIMAMISAQMLFDQMFVVEGAYRHVEFEVQPETLTCALFPAAVSAAPALTLLQTIALSGLVISRMLACSEDPELRTEVQSCMGAPMYPIAALSGVNQRGAPYVSFLLDPVGAALAGLSWRDGVDTGGWPWDLQSTMPNVEENEWFYPILYLWRRELPDSGGAGKFRGGNAAELAFLPHGTDRIALFTATGHCAVPGPGLFGGFPTSTTRYAVIRGTHVRELMSEGRMPDRVEDLGGEMELIPPKAFDIVQHPDDVFLMSWASAGGYGDPLQRDPERVAEDYREGRITREWARRAYGVVLDEVGQVVRSETEQLRMQMRRQRIGREPKPQGAIDEPEARLLAEGLKLIGGWIRCRYCDQSLAPARENYKLRCVQKRFSIQEANPHTLDPKLYIEEDIEWWHYYCPGCGALLETELARPSDAPLWDLQLDLG